MRNRAEGGGRLIFLDAERLAVRLPALGEQWHAAPTTAHSLAVADDLLSQSKSREIFDGFPEDSWPEWDDVGDSLQAGKLSCERFAVFPPGVGAFVNELNSGPFLRFLEALTGIDGLVPDPHLWGGGLHLMRPGGYLWPHTDFLQGKIPGMMRVINLIFYAHSRWTPEMGGHFEVWDGETLMHSLPPLPGRCVIFKTDAHSIHGVSRVKGELTRKSIALFYYTVSERQNIALDYTTGWRLGLAPQGSAVGTLRRAAAEVLMRTSFGLKRAAVALNEKAERVANSRRA